MTVVKDGQKTDLLVIVEEGHNDEELTFQDTFLPDLLEKNVSSLTSVEGIYFSLPESYKGILSGRKIPSPVPAKKIQHTGKMFSPLPVRITWSEYLGTPPFWILQSSMIWLNSI